MLWNTSSWTVWCPWMKHSSNSEGFVPAESHQIRLITLGTHNLFDFIVLPLCCYCLCQRCAYSACLRMRCVLRASVYFFSHSFTLAVRLWSKSWYFWVDCLFLCKYVHGIINDFSCILLFCISIFILRTVYVLVCMWLFACTYVWWLRLWVCLCVNVFICVSLLCLCTCREVTWWRTRISETSGSLIQDIERKSSTRHATCPRCLIS